MVISAGKWKDPTVGASRSSTPPDENVTGASGVFNHSQRLIDNDGHKGSSCHGATSAILTGFSVSRASTLEFKYCVKFYRNFLLS